MDEEIWVPAVGWDKYEVSHLGNIRSYRFKKNLTPRGRSVVLSRSGSSQQTSVTVDSIVLESFTGRTLYPGEQVWHLDGDISNNALSNLEIGHSRCLRGHDKVGLNVNDANQCLACKQLVHPNSRVTPENVEEVAELLARGEPNPYRKRSCENCGWFLPKNLICKRCGVEHR